MTNQKSKSDNFWSGYSMGMIAGAVATYAFGTKRGRDFLKKALDQTDNLEHDIEDVFHLIQDKVISLEKDVKKKIKE